MISDARSGGDELKIVTWRKTAEGARMWRWRKLSMTGKSWTLSTNVCVSSTVRLGELVPVRHFPVHSHVHTAKVSGTCSSELFLCMKDLDVKRRRACGRLLIANCVQQSETLHDPWNLYMFTHFPSGFHEKPSQHNTYPSLSMQCEYSELCYAPININMWKFLFTELFEAYSYFMWKFWNCFQHVNLIWQMRKTGYCTIVSSCHSENVLV